MLLSVFLEVDLNVTVNFGNSFNPEDVNVAAVIKNSGEKEIQLQAFESIIIN